MKYASGYHAPVLCHTVIEGLITSRDGVYVDGTLGGGGHTAAILDALSGSGRVVAIDQDDEAIREASARLAEDVAAQRLSIVKGNFSEMARLLETLGVKKVDGILLDLGVSSHQLDEADRGFSHRMRGPLDMRMDRDQGEGAAQLVNEWDEKDLMHVLFRFGEEPKARRIARAIAEQRPVASTESLAQIVRNCVPHNQESKTLARVFQAIRIAVNRELEALDQVLLDSVELLRDGGRLAVISYHSLEDRRVKRFLRSGNLEGKIQKDIFGNQITPWKELNRRPISADEEEQASNPRSRSARLRIAERVDNSNQNAL